MSKLPFPDMDELLQRLLDDQIQPEEMESLQKAIRENPQVRDYYIDSMLACAVTRRSCQVTEELIESDLIGAISAKENHGGSKGIVKYLYSIAAVLMIGVLLLASISMFRKMTRGPAIGTVAGVYEAQWRGSRPKTGKPLYTGSYDLCEGAAKMELGDGTSLLLEAPCQIELKSVDEVDLNKGRIVIAVSSQTRDFRVQTPTAVITDLGTEFGVIVNPDGSAEAHVLKGSIYVALNPNGTNQLTSLVLNEGQAMSVDADGRAVPGDLAARKDLFLLELPSSGKAVNPSQRLNLADIVGGGNGCGSGKFESGIDLGTAQAFKQHPNKIKRVRQNKFQPTPFFAGIDGVFVPNRASGPVVISSTGLTFPDCPQTLGSYYGGPTNSGKFYDILSRKIYTARFNGISLGTSRHPALNLHPNAGITFDLDQIRQDNPDIQIDRFTASCGIPKDLPQKQFSTADVWILLDGDVALHLRHPPGRSVVEKVNVPIPAGVRFLTLVTTCTGRADYSWIFFGDPFFEPDARVHTER